MKISDIKEELSIRRNALDLQPLEGGAGGGGYSPGQFALPKPSMVGKTSPVTRPQPMSVSKQAAIGAAVGTPAVVAGLSALNTKDKDNKNMATSPTQTQPATVTPAGASGAPGSFQRGAGIAAATANLKRPTATTDPRSFQSPDGGAQAMAGSQATKVPGAPNVNLAGATQAATTTSSATPTAAAAPAAAPAATPTAAAAPASPAQQGYQSKNKAFADKVNQAAAASGLKDMNKIQPGQKIKMPDGSEHVVQRGETLSGIIAGKKAGATAPIKPPAPTAPAPASPQVSGQPAGAGSAIVTPQTPIAQSAMNQAQPTTQAATAPVLGTPENPYPQGAEVKSGSGETIRTGDGSALRTRSDAEIGDTNPRTGVVTPGSYDKQRAQGEKNLQSLKNLLGFGKKEAPTAPTPAAPTTQSATTTPATTSAGSGSPLSGARPAVRTFETKLKESDMELNLLRKYSGLSEVTEDTTVHKGTYGTSYGKEDVRDQYGHKIGRVDKGADAKKEQPKRGRGRPTKGDKDEHGHSTKFDTSGLQGMLGGKPKGEVGKKSVKHSLKDWIESISDSMINEAEEEKTMSRAAKGHEKYGKEGMQALAKAGRDGASEKKLDTIRNKYDKYDKEDIAEGREFGSYYDEKVAQQVFEQDPDITSEDEVLNRAYAIVKADQGHKFARYKFNYDEDFPSDIVSNYFHLKRQGVAEAKNLPGKQDKLDVAPPKGKLDAKDFAALRGKKKVKESLSFNEMMNETNIDMQDMLQELQQDIEHYNNTGHCSDKLEAFLKIHGHTKKRITDEEAGAGRGSINPPAVNPNMPAPAARTASPGWGKDDYKPLIPDTHKGPSKMAIVDPEGVKEAGSFIRNLASSRRAFEGKDMKDVQLESWEKDLNSLLNENITISTTIDDQGHDSVSVNATEANAHEIIELLRNAGIGGMGSKKEQGQEVNNYGLPMSGDEHQGPEAQLIAVGDPHAGDSMGDEGGDDMLALIKKMTGIEDSGEEEHGSQDYEQEGGEEGHEEEHGEENSDDEEEEEVDEAEMEEGNKFTGNLAKARAQGKEQADLDGDGDMEKVQEADMEEGNMFTGNLAKARAQGKEQADLDGDGDMEKVDEGHGETCNECGSSMYEGHTCGSEPVEEGTDEGFANSDDDTAYQDIAYMMKTLSGGGGMGEKRSQATGPIVKIVTAEGTMMKDSTDLLSDFRKLSGI